MHRDLIRYVLARAGASTLTRILKLLFLADYYAMYYLSKRITKTEWVNHYYGAFSWDLVNEITNDEEIDSRYDILNDRVYYVYNGETPTIDYEVKEFLDYVIDKYKNYTDYELVLESKKLAGVEPGDVIFRRVEE